MLLDSELMLLVSELMLLISELMALLITELMTELDEELRCPILSDPPHPVSRILRIKNVRSDRIRFMTVPLFNSDDNACYRIQPALRCCVNVTGTTG
jgi:hypothetical protein